MKPPPKEQARRWEHALPENCLACGREEGYAMCDLCARLTTAELNAKKTS